MKIRFADVESRKLNGERREQVGVKLNGQESFNDAAEFSRRVAPQQPILTSRERSYFDYKGSFAEGRECDIPFLSPSWAES